MWFHYTKDLGYALINQCYILQKNSSDFNGYSVLNFSILPQVIEEGQFLHNLKLPCHIAHGHHKHQNNVVLAD
jgi:hypothetical protein